MIAVYLRPDLTQIVVGQKKGKVLHIQEIKSIDQNYLQALELNDNEAILELEYFFQDIKSITRRRDEEIYLVLPDYLFAMVDCFYSNSEEQTKDEITHRLNEDISNFYYSIPVVTTPEQQKPMITVCVLAKKIADLFAAAAENMKAHLVSIEAASVAFLRARCEYNTEQLALFIFENKATFVAYSHNGGIFKIDNNDMSMNELANKQKNIAEQLIVESMNEFELVCKETFEYLNQDLPYTVIGSQLMVKSYEALAKRATDSRGCNKFLVDGPTECQDQQWMCAVGTLLQHLDFSAAELENFTVDYEQISSGNVLPEEIQNKSKAFRRMQKFYKISKAAMLLMVFTAATEIIMILLFSSTHIPDGLQEDYESGQESITKIEKELSVISQEEKEDQRPLEVYKTVMSVRPAEIGFVSFEVGSDSKINQAEWVKVKMLAADPLKFQQYINDLSGCEMFSGVAIPQMTTDTSSNAKIANLVLGRGK